MVSPAVSDTSYSKSAVAGGEASRSGAFATYQMLTCHWHCLLHLPTGANGRGGAINKGKRQRRPNTFERQAKEILHESQRGRKGKQHEKEWDQIHIRNGLLDTKQRKNTMTRGIRTYGISSHCYTSANNSSATKSSTSSSVGTLHQRNPQ